jgi:hypothetical protein
MKRVKHIPLVRHLRTWSPVGFHKSACGGAGWRKNDATSFRDVTCKVCKRTERFREQVLKELGQCDSSKGLGVIKRGNNETSEAHN